MCFGGFLVVLFLISMQNLIYVFNQNNVVPLAIVFQDSPNLLKISKRFCTSGCLYAILLNLDSSFSQCMQCFRLHLPLAVASSHPDCTETTRVSVNGKEAHFHFIV